MGYKFIEDSTKPFVADHNGAAQIDDGLLTWSEGSTATDGIRAAIGGEPNTFYTNDRTAMRLLSNDLNLLFNLDRTIYVSGKGTEFGMAKDTSGISKIQHFDTISHALYDTAAFLPIMTQGSNTVDLWSSNVALKTLGLQIMIGPGNFAEDSGLFSKLSLDTDGSSFRKLHIKGYGNDTHITTSLDWDCVMDYSVRKPLLLENIVIDNLSAPLVNGLDIPVSFKHVYVIEEWNPDFFNLTNCKKFNGEITFNNAKAVFTGTNFWTLYKDTGVGTYKQKSEKQYVGTSTT